MGDGQIVSTRGFHLDRVLHEDAKTRYAALLGHYELEDDSTETAVLLLEKTHFSPSFYRQIGAEGKKCSLEHSSSLGSNDIYSWLLGWMPALRTENQYSSSKDEQDAHVKLTLIRPASEAHIAKYSEQAKVMIVETPQMYDHIVRPWIESQPLERIQWVYNILDKKKEADTILFEKAGEKGFLIVPDLKWDRKTLSSLYLIAIVHDRSLRSLRNLTREHIPLLRSIHAEGEKLCTEKFQLVDNSGYGNSKLRCFIHYQPTYYHLHVHMLSSDYVSHPGAIVGQAHLLDDIIDLLESGLDFSRRTLTYSLGETSKLLQEIRSTESHGTTHKETQRNEENNKRMKLTSPHA